MDYEQRKIRQQKLWKIWYIALVLCVGITTIFGIIIGHYDYNFEVNKCKNLKTSNYDFNIDAQINAEYAQSCYYYMYHPLAYFGSLFVSVLLVNLVAVMFLGLPFAITAFKINEYY